VNTPLWAGFECGHLGWCNQDLLQETRHTPTTDMTAHYDRAKALGIRTARDGLPWRHEPSARIAAVPDDVRVIWDLCHFDPPPHREAHAMRCASAMHGPAHVVAVNEPSLWPLLCRRPRREAIATGKRMMSAFGLMADARFYTCDPFHRLNEDVFAATDALVATGWISVVGVNYYPHDATVPLVDVLRAVWARYGLPIAIMETSWHVGHPKARRRFPFIGDSQATWLAHVQAEVAASGAPVEGICWYPFLDQPVWGKPGTRRRWPCGWHGQVLDSRTFATVRDCAVGDHVVRASCCGCGRQVSLDLKSLVQTRYADVGLDKLPFRCTACEGRLVEITVEDAPAPRGRQI
jgi:hypothetical protein